MHNSRNLSPRCWIALVLALACGGCATGDLATRSDRADSPVAARPGLAPTLYDSYPAAPTPSMPMSGPGSPDEVQQASFVRHAAPATLPPEVFPPRMDYLHQGAVFGPRSLPPVQPTATERMLEMQDLLERLLADNEQFKRRVAKVEDELATNQTQLKASQREVESLRHELETIQKHVRTTFEQLERVAEQLETNEQTHLQQLDEIIGLMRTTVRRQMLQAVSPPDEATE